jgi:hypothetical protein
MAGPQRERIDKWDYMKPKNFYIRKGMVTDRRGWDKIFASYTFDKD